MTVSSSLDPLHLELGDRSYDIYIGPGLLDMSGTLLRRCFGGRKLFVVTDENVENMYVSRLTYALDQAGLEWKIFSVPSGEASKSFNRLEILLESMIKSGCERGTGLLAFGGGAVGDLTGFAASILLRGVPYFQIPTTLLAQVDSSVGGKTGINSRSGKNLIGSFYQPRLVIADISLLASLPIRQLRSGYAEIVKYGLINDPEFFAWLEENGHRLFNGDEEAMANAVRVSCLSKAVIVGKDEREGGIRALLNLGHTFAHALEVETGYGDALYHGEAVSIGMVLAFDLSVRLGICPKSDLERLIAHLESMGMPVRLPSMTVYGDWDVTRFMAHFTRDKKIMDGKVGFILTRGIGKSFQSADVQTDDLGALLEQAIAGRENSPSTPFPRGRRGSFPTNAVAGAIVKYD